MDATLAPRTPLNAASVTILYDCESAAGVAGGTSRFKKVVEASRLTRALATLISQTMTMHHIHSHEGHPLNELVDAMATGAGLGRMSWAPAVQPTCLRWSDDGYRMAEWAFIHKLEDMQKAAYPPISSCGTKLIPNSHKHCEYRLPESIIAEHLDGGCASVNLKAGPVTTEPLTAASINAQTMLKQGKNVSYARQLRTKK